MISWVPVTEEGQLKKGMTIKIIGESPKDSYRWITIKKVLNMEGADGRKWIEILINKKKNYYFNLTVYLSSDGSTCGKWVKKLYFKPMEKMT